MKIMPVNETKEYIRDYVSDLCISTNPKRVFSLIGTDAGMVSKLPSYVEIVSAEIQTNVFMLQRKLYPQYKTKLAKASMALLLDKGIFDFIWLDFFGNMFDDSNYEALVVSRDKISTDGIVAVTSNKRSRNTKSSIPVTTALSVVGYNIADVMDYRNCGNNMSLFILTPAADV